MPFIPHTEQEIADMLEAIGVAEIENLFDEIPDSLRAGSLNAIPEGLTEMEVSRLLHQRARQNSTALCFIGAGAYEHHIPAAVWELCARGEFYTAYTPYQAEASQGTLQIIYEYQSMMTALTAMDVSNASMYDGASALAEAVLMAVRADKRIRSGGGAAKAGKVASRPPARILMPTNLHPVYRKVTHTIVHGQQIELIDVPFDRQTGSTDLAQLEACAGETMSAVVIGQPNFFGQLEDVDAITDWAHKNNMLVIAVVNPLLLSVLKPPGQWGETGADIVCGDGQPLGAPLAAGGPYFGFLCCRQALLRQLPGRIVGRTEDLDGNPGFVLTLQAREQHIRRSRATSNICTNQGLMVVAATIHMAILGAQGLENTAAACYANSHELATRLSALEGVRLVFNSPYFHEFVLQFEQPVAAILTALAARGILGGVDISRDYPSLGQALLVCATEMRSAEDIAAYVAALQAVLGQASEGEYPLC